MPGHNLPIMIFNFREDGNRESGAANRSARSSTTRASFKAQPWRLKAIPDIEPAPHGAATCAHEPPQDRRRGMARPEVHVPDRVIVSRLKDAKRAARGRKELQREWTRSAAKGSAIRRSSRPDRRRTSKRGVCLSVVLRDGRGLPQSRSAKFLSRLAEISVTRARGGLKGVILSIASLQILAASRSPRRPLVSFSCRFRTTPCSRGDRKYAQVGVTRRDARSRSKASDLEEGRQAKRSRRGRCNVVGA